MSKKKPNVASFLGAVARGSIKDRSIKKYYQVQKVGALGAGMKYVHPADEGTYVRVMPGKPHSPNPYQQKPYVTYQKNGNTMDKSGNIVNKEALEAHISHEEFFYKE